MMNKDDAPGLGQLRRSRWRKSSYSGTAGNCVEVAELGPARVVSRLRRCTGIGADYLVQRR